MRCIHHTDDDGLCSASIVGSLFADRILTDDDFIPYTHGMDLKLPDDLKEKEKWYIVDLALDEVIFGAIKQLVEAGCEVIHIDHHQSGIDYYESLSEEDQAIMNSNQVIFYWDTSCSASLLTWIYSSMDDKERLAPAAIEWRYDEHLPKHSKFMLSSRPADYKMYIPQVVRYVNDWDIWEFALADTREFHTGFKSEPDKKPLGETWKFMYGNERIAITKTINDGRANLKYEANMYEHIVKNGFEATVHTSKGDITAFMVNSPVGDGTLFGDKRHEYPMCILYHYDGRMNTTKYSFYSDEGVGIHVNEIAAEFGGGGHLHAAGCQTNEKFWEKK